MYTSVSVCTCTRRFAGVRIFVLVVRMYVTAHKMLPIAPYTCSAHVMLRMALTCLSPITLRICHFTIVGTNKDRHVKACLHLRHFEGRMKETRPVMGPRHFETASFYGISIDAGCHATSGSSELTPP